MTPRTRQTLLYSILLGTGLAAYLAPQEEKIEPSRYPEDLASNPGAHRIAPSSFAAVVGPALMPKDRTLLTDMPRDLFHIEPLPAEFTDAEPEQVAQPLAPPLPYAYMGKSVGQGQITVFLTRDEKPYVARLGDILDDQYRIDAINPPVIEFTYLPLAQKQMLHIGVTR